MRECCNCQKELPPETKHFDIDDEIYCTDCVEAVPYTSYSYYIGGEYVGGSEEDNVLLVESYDDEYEGGEDI